jgi:HPt (histidine-containing phosphotransfer) domain-containing protein
MDNATSASARQEPVLQPNALDAIVEMIGIDDPDVVVDLIDTFLTDSQRQIDEMHRSMAAGDIKTLHRAAHSMKSSSATFGALALSKLCQRLEQSAKDQCVDGACAEQIEIVTAEHGLVVAALRAERAKLTR